MGIVSFLTSLFLLLIIYGALRRICLAKIDILWEKEPKRRLSVWLRRKYC